jgi:spermidine/putrescine transport system ATP-binding protein
MSKSQSEEYIRIRRGYRQFTTPEGSVIKALDGVDIAIARKEFITLLGPSGCGKTTLLKIIAGFESLDRGDVLIDDESIVALPAHKRPVNTVFQSYALFPHMTVEDNVGYGLDVAKVNKDERNQRVKEALEMVGLSGTEKRVPSQLSGGQQQRVALARAIINRPKLLLLDEPLSALDKNLRLKMQLELKRLQTELGICFVFVTHDQEEALTISDRIVVLNGGKVQQMGTPDEIYHTPENKFVATFIGESNIFNGKVILIENHVAVVDCNGIKVFCEAGNYRIGDSVELLLRPEQFAVKPVIDQGLTHGIDMTIDEVVFVGADYQLHGKLTNGQSVSALARRSDGSYRAGDTVTLYYQVNAPHVISLERKSEREVA